MTSTTGSEIGEPVRFAPFNSFVDHAFWFKLTQLKLHEYKLDESLKPISGFYVNSDAPNVPTRLTIDFNALEPKASHPSQSYPYTGHLFLANHIDGFKQVDKQKYLRDAAEQDVKKFHYHYWFGYPTLCFPQDIVHANLPCEITNVYSQSQIKDLQETCSNFLDKDKSGYFTLFERSAKGDGAAFEIYSLQEGLSTNDTSGLILGFCDPSTFSQNPGWPLRNLLALYASQKNAHFPVRVLCWRNRYLGGSLECGHSLMLEINATIPSDCDMLNVIGWEANGKGIKGPRFVDLSGSMDPKKLAENAVHLNLELMRWRLVPELQLKPLRELKILILGAGTLGSNIARNLLGWGIHHITFVDNGKVSYSNPVRQSLMQFKDCLDGGKYKAEAAAEAVTRIYPLAKTSGIVLTIPMPGHLVDEKEKDTVKDTVHNLEQLIQQHDVVFLVTDTRESRWLPTLLCAYHNKIAFSVALGFDSYVVVRHGFGPEPVDISAGLAPTSLKNFIVPGDRLACYFCSDVVAPGDSTRDRTLDQQCTVTRPGVSSIAAALVVEVLVSLMQHPQGPLAAAEANVQPSTGPSSHETCLGIVPHQIRGFISRFDQILPTVQRFASCTGCSNVVIDKYKELGFEFLFRVFNDPTYLEKVTGLDELQRNCENIEILELSDSESIISSS